MLKQMLTLGLFAMMALSTVHADDSDKDVVPQKLACETCGGKKDAEEPKEAKILACNDCQ